MYKQDNDKRYNFIDLDMDNTTYMYTLKDTSCRLIFELFET